MREKEGLSGPGAQSSGEVLGHGRCDDIDEISMAYTLPVPCEIRLPPFYTTQHRDRVLGDELEVVL